MKAHQAPRVPGWSTIGQRIGDGGFARARDRLTGKEAA